MIEREKPDDEAKRAQNNDSNEIEDDDSFFDFDPETVVQDNEKYLREFEQDLEQAGLKDATIGRHLFNAELFLNTWLAEHEGLTMEEGLEYMDEFLGDWYIRRCMWSTPANIKSTAASLKKFYKSMADHGHIGAADHKALVSEIKSELPEWQRRCWLYNDPNTEWEDIAGEFGFPIF